MTAGGFWLIELLPVLHTNQDLRTVDGRVFLKKKKKKKKSHEE